MRRNRKSTIMLGLIILFLGLGIGYAFITTTLTIDGTTDVDSNTWNVYWDNIQVSYESVEGDQVITAPTIDANKTTVSFRVRLKPEDVYEFTIDAINSGSLDAMIDTVVIPDNIPSYIKYNVSYEDDIKIERKQLLASNSVEKYKIRVEYDLEDATELPETSQTLSLSFAVTYVQADNEAVAVYKPARYTNSFASYHFGDMISPSEPFFGSFQEAMDFSNKPFAIKYIVYNNEVYDTYLAFTLNDFIYYLDGDQSSYNEQMASYDKNIIVLKKAFGEENCTYDSYYQSQLTCQDVSTGLSARVEDNRISVGDGEVGCRFDSNGSSTCFYGSF